MSPHHVKLCIFCAAPHLIGECGLGIILRVSVIAVLVRVCDVDAVSHTVEFVLFVTAFSPRGSLLLAAVVSGVVVVASGVVIVIGYQPLDPCLECSL